MKVSLFVTCLADQCYPETGMSVVRVLRKLGCEVDFPAGQVCCGQPAFNSGYTGEARRVAATLLDAFESSEYVVTPSGSCAGMVKHYFAELFAGDEKLAARATALAAKTYEFSQFLVQVLKRTDLGAAFPASATFHPSCHASRLLGVKEEPLKLMAGVQGLELRPLERAEDCCGFGGSFAVKMEGLSGAMLEEKAAHIMETGASCLIGTDLGCLMNIAGCLQKKGSSVKVMHLADILDGAKP